MPLKSKKRFNPSITLPVIILILLLDLLFLYYLKYDNQNLLLTEFNLYNIGNFLNLLFTALIIFGTLGYSIRKKNKSNPKLLIVFTAILTTVLVFAAISIKVDLPFAGTYIFFQPLPKLIITSLFTLYQFIQFVFLTVLWLSLFGGKDILILRASINSVILIVLLFLFAFFYLSSQTDNGLQKLKSMDNSNIAVVLGAAVWSNNVPSPSLAARSEKAAELFHKGYVGNVQLTGGNAPGELSEAEVAYNYIKMQNVDSTHIFVEKNTTSTSEQIEFIKNNLVNNSNINNVFIVSDSYHLTRIKEICTFYNVKAEVIASDLTLSFENKIYYKIRESVALILFWFFAL